jgi:type I restriction enzyme S subunit
MSYLDTLLKGVEVEWKTLGEVAIKISSGGTPNTGVSTYYNGDIPWLRTQEVGYGDIWGTEIKITELGLQNSSAKIIPENCVIVAMYGATVGKVGINKIPLSTNQACANINLNEKVAHYRYVYHFLLSQYEYIKSLGAGSQTNINAQIIKKLQIPIPPLSVQKEIIRILDTFTELTAELTTELTARKKQFNYYQNTLFKFNDIAQISITELCSIKARIGWQGLSRKEYLSNGEYYLVTGVDFTSDHHIDFKNCHYVTQERYNQDTNIQIHEGDLLITKDGTLGKIAIIDKEPDKQTTLNSGVFVLRIKDQRILLRFLYHYLISDYFTEFIETVKTGSTVPHLTQTGLVNLKIPIPPIEEQSRIVTILDKFDILTTSISEGLPKEIELRKKQYEYYRDMLLTFPKKEIA